MSVTLGDNLTMTGFFVLSLTLRVTAASRFGLGTEDDAPFFDVRAGNIDFKACDAVDVEVSRDLSVFFHTAGRDIDDERRLTGRRYLRQDVPFKGVDAGVFQADAVEHACRRFGDADTGVARPRQGRNALGDDGPDGVEVEKITVFNAESEGSRRPHDRRFHRDTGEFDGNPFTDHQKTSFAGKTGPSVQTL